MEKRRTEPPLLRCVGCGTLYPVRLGGPPGCPRCGCVSWVSSWIADGDEPPRPRR